MKMPPLAMSVTDWMGVEATRHAGDAGFALWQTRAFGDIRVRMVEYSPGYVADHWCAKGHVILCLQGSLDIELADGTRHELLAGQSYHVGDGNPAHKSSAPQGARLFIVD
jgi:hypothetical protein